MTERRRLIPWLLAALATLMLVPRLAVANEYEVFVDVDSEDDLYDLQVTGEIGTGTLEILIDLIRRGIDLNTATREQLYALPNLTYDDVDAILAYRDEAGRIGDPAALVVVGALSRRKLQAIAAFLIVPGEEGSEAAVRGFVRYQTIWTVEDKRAPPMALQARVSALRHLTVGAAAVLDRNRLAPVTWDPNRDGLSSSGPRTRPRVPKYYAQWDTPQWGIIAGTYTIGFGQRLVFDTSGRYTPNGFFLDDSVYRTYNLTTECRESTGELSDSPCPSDADRRYVTPDFSARERQRGVAVGAKHIDMPVGWLQAYGFFSHQTKPIYQYGLFDRSVCDDPRTVLDECSSPEVYLRRPNPLAQQSTLRFATLPNMYNEVQGGGNISYFVDRRTHVGVTAYGSGVNWLVDEAELDFQEWQRTPYGGPFGAAGADASWGRKWADLFLEVAYSFDSIDQGGGGGPAAILRHTATWDTHEIEASLRYYDEQYQNPYSRAIASADQSNGLRASDETGGRLRYTGVIAERLDLRALFDVWHEPSTSRTKLNTYARADVQVLPWFKPGMWVDYQTRDIGARGRNRCYGGFVSDSGVARGDFAAGVEGDNGVVSPATDGSFSTSDALFGVDNGGCAGERFRLTPRIRLDPHKRVYTTLQFQYSWIDDARYDDRFANDVRATALVGVNPIDALRLRFRVAYDFDDISDNTYLEQTLWAYAQAQYRLQSWFQPTIRYDIRFWLDDRESTAFRTPDPEHWLLFQVMSRF